METTTPEAPADEVRAPGHEADQGFAQTARGLWQDERVEIVAAILLSLATVLAAWGAYQATRWSGEQADAYAESAALRASAGRQAAIASRQIQIDVTAFLSWAQAKATDDDRLADFLRARFRPRIRAGLRFLGG